MGRNRESEVMRRGTAVALKRMCARVSAFPRRAIHAGWMMVSLLVAADANGQENVAVRQLRLRSDSQIVSEDFNGIRGVRELSDGRVLVADHFPFRLLIVDWSTGHAHPLSREGSGPGEFRSISRLLALPNDSTLLVDGTLNRLLIFHGARVASAIGSDHVLSAGLESAAMGADDNGHILAKRLLTSNLNQRPPGAHDSIEIVLGSRQSGRLETISRLSAGPAPALVRLRSAQGNIAYFLRNPLAENDQAILFHDGWIAVAYARPFRVDWRNPAGSWSRGAPLRNQVVRADDGERRAAIARQWFVPWYTGPRWSVQDFHDWPATLPPFEPDALLASPEGLVVIRRTPSSRQPGVRYDFVDRTSGLVATLVLGDRERLAGFGANWVYVIQRDEDDLEHLRRHPWHSPLAAAPPTR